MLVYRIAKERYTKDLSGEGARLVGGRWNTPGRPMLYASASRSLALLESLAHSTILPQGLALITLRLPSRVRVGRIAVHDLPKDWDHIPPLSVSQEIGDDFLRSAKYLAVRVPSVLVREEENILINPAHALAGKIEVIDVLPLDVDHRLK